MMVRLRVLCWDHPRCTGPVEAAAAAYQARFPDVQVEWRARPLAMFNDQPAADAAPGFDLIFVDHPLISADAAAGSLVPLDDILAADELRRIGSESVGGGHEPYTWGGQVWALGADAACQVAAVREDRLLRLGVEAPTSWDGVVKLAAAAPGSVALPLYPSDAICTLISLSANASSAAGDPPRWLRREAVEFLVELAGLVEPSCFELNPPRLLARMAAGSGADGDDRDGDDRDGWGAVAYVPFTFGYATLCWPPLRFTDVPGCDGRSRGAVLGGAGLAVLSSSRHIDAAAAFAAWYMDPATQRDVVVPSGGQPGNRLAWDDPVADQRVNGFFSATRGSMDHAYLRPREPWWPAFQQEAGQVLVRLLRNGAAPVTVLDDLARLADKHEGVGR
jgi:multiple sugar transport system substrate-binding protein